MSDKVQFSTIIEEEVLEAFKQKVDSDLRTYSAVINKLMELYINETLDDLFRS